jgi:hypothetical protein
MRCARCHRSIKGAFTWHLGYPFGPVCAEKMALTDKKERARVVRDNQTLDLFNQDQSTDTK